MPVTRPDAQAQAAEAPQSQPPAPILLPGSPPETVPASQPADAPQTIGSQPSSPAQRAPVEVPLGQGRTPGIGPQPARLFAARVSYIGSTVIAEGGIAPGSGEVIFESGFGTVRAQKVTLDTAARTLVAEGKVTVTRTRETVRRELTPRSIPTRTHPEVVTDTLRGENLKYDFNTQHGNLDHAVVAMSNFTLSTTELYINGRQYVAHNIVLRPGGLSEADTKIYGTPPFSLHAKELTINAGANGANSRVRAEARGGGLFFKNTKILPVPSYVLKSVGTGGGRDNQAFTLTPRPSVNSVDGFLLTTRLQYPLSKNSSGAELNADVGVSARIGLRGGLSLEDPTRLGTFSLKGRVNDIVTTQLTNRIVLDREPEVTYASPLVPLFGLPGGRKAGLFFGAGVGRFAERTIGDIGGEVHSTRSEASVVLSTRGVQKDGPYLDVFSRYASYSRFGQSYQNAGFEVGYYGDLIPRVRGLFSYRATDLSGSTPFRFDQVEIAREVRTTFDVKLTPRYIVPFDFRYDLDLNRLRDERFGLLRNYKTFAYGATYQTARHELSVELRNGF